MLSLFVICLVFWLLLSGHGDVFHVTAGAAAAALVVWLNRADGTIGAVLQALPRLALHLPWLVAKIVRANLDVARRVLDPRLPIEPAVHRIHAPLRNDTAMTTLANSITLTPGTVTLDVEGEVLVVHALTASAAQELAGGAMTARVERLFGTAR